MIARQHARRHFTTSLRCAAALEEQLSSALVDMKDNGTYKVERVIVTPQDSSISVDSSPEPVINFCANNYLGLSNHPDLVEAAKDALDSHGFGLSSVRFICGTQDIHKQLERVISEYHGMDDTILYPSCFDANAGLFEAVLTRITRNHEKRFADLNKFLFALLYLPYFWTRTTVANLSAPRTELE
jgi:7-keto-8-aminopelargonate synthetase-like enzyme